MRIDLHCHSSASDGCLSPVQVAARMVARGVQVAALTDHHTTGGYEQFRTVLARHGVQCVTGVEIFVETSLGQLHLLAYGFDIHDRALSQVLRVLSQPLWGAMRHWMERTWAHRTRTHGTGFGPSAPPFNPSSLSAPATIANGGLEAAEGLRIIHNAGGRAFLAHPLLTSRTLEQLEAQVQLLIPLGLDGIEAFYKPYAPTARRSLLELARRHGLLVSGGSDFHGPAYPGGAAPGCEIPHEEWCRLAAALGLEHRP